MTEFSLQSHILLRLPDVVFALPPDDRDTIWSKAFTDYDRPCVLRPFSENSIGSISYEADFCCSLKLSGCSAARNETPLLLVNKVIHSNAQRHLFRRLEKISLCYYGCLRTRLLDTKGWGPLGRATSLEYPF